MKYDVKFQKKNSCSCNIFYTLFMHIVFIFCVPLHSHTMHFDPNSDVCWRIPFETKESTPLRVFQNFLSEINATMIGKARRTCFISRSTTSSYREHETFIIQSLMAMGLHVICDEPIKGFYEKGVTEKLDFGTSADEFMRKIDTVDFVVPLYHPDYYKRSEQTGEMSGVQKEIARIARRFASGESSFFVGLLVEGRKENSVPVNLEQYVFNSCTDENGKFRHERFIQELCCLIEQKFYPDNADAIALVNRFRNIPQYLNTRSLYGFIPHIEQVMQEHVEEVHTLMDSFLRVDDTLCALQEKFIKERCNRVVFPIGLTGSGKSTLLNLVAGKSLVSLDPDENSAADYVLVSPEGFFDVAQGCSVTLHPKGVINGTTGFIDMPGLNDNRGERENILVAYIIYKAFKLFAGSSSDMPLSIMLCLNDDMVKDDRSTNLSDLINLLGEIFQRSLDEFMKSSTLVITKAKPIVKKGRLFSLQEEDYLKMLASNGNPLEREKDFKDKLIQARRSDQRMHVFRAPDDEGKMDYTAFVSGLINSLASSQHHNIHPCIFLKGDVAAHLERVELSVSKKAIRFLREGLRQVYMKMASEASDVNQLREDFKKFHDVLLRIKGQLSAQTNAADLLQEIIDFHGAYKNELNSFQNILDNLRFLFEASGGLCKSHDKWATALSEIALTLESLTRLPEMIVENDIIRIKGSIIGLKDMIRFVQPRIKRVDVIATDFLFIDEDFERKTQDIPFIFIASSPFWKVVGNKKIDLSGLKGEDYSTCALASQEGLPGLPGFTGGSFYGFGQYGMNFEKLTIDLSGGIGGDGQHGAQGSDGRDASEKTAEEFPWTDDPTENEHYSFTGETGEKGGNGTNGGLGGIGGYSGTLGIFGFDSYHFGTLNLRQGDNGNHGLGGEPGTGGKNAHNVSRFYVGNTTTTVIVLQQTVRCPSRVVSEQSTIYRWKMVTNYKYGCDCGQVNESRNNDGNADFSHDRVIPAHPENVIVPAHWENASFETPSPLRADNGERGSVSTISGNFPLQVQLLSDEEIGRFLEFFSS